MRCRSSFIQPDKYKYTDISVFQIIKVIDIRDIQLWHTIRKNFNWQTVLRVRLQCTFRSFLF